MSKELLSITVFSEDLNVFKLSLEISFPTDLMPWLAEDCMEMRAWVNLVSEQTPPESTEKLFLDPLDQFSRAKFMKQGSSDPLALPVQMPAVGRQRGAPCLFPRAGAICASHGGGHPPLPLSCPALL